MKKKSIIIYNFIVFFALLILLELVLGEWLSKYNFGYHMRDKRLITYNVNTSFDEADYNFNYMRNFYGFRMNYDLSPESIDIVFQGGSTADEMPIPFDMTIVGNLNRFLKNNKINHQVTNAALSGKSTAGYNNDFRYWFPRLKGYKPKIMIFLSGHNDADLMQDYMNRLDEFALAIENKTHSDSSFVKALHYITNNSFILIKLKKIKDLHYDLHRQKVLYDLSKEDLYNRDYTYINYQLASKMYKSVPLNELQKKTLQFYKVNLNQLKTYLDKWNIEPIFVTQTRFDGISTHRLYFVNEETKKFCEKNNYKIIKLDEIYKPEEGDYFDFIHTTPQGSLKIAKIIYPSLKESISKIYLSD